MHSRRLMRPLAVALSVICALATTPATALAESIESAQTTRYATEEAYLGANPDAARSEEAAPIVSQDSSWQRLQGQTRYQTMQAISYEAMASSEWVVLAQDNNFPDALAASALAGVLRAPVLLVSQYGIPTETYAEIMRLGAKSAYIVGGEAAIGYEVSNQLSDMGISWTRIAGVDRRQTSVKVAQEVFELGRQGRGAAKSDMVVVATGSSFADALSIAPWCYATATPILLTDGTGTLSDEAVAAVKAEPSVNRTIAIGGDAVVSDTVDDQLGLAYFERLGGSDRYQTSASVASWEVVHGFSWNGIVLATGKNFPDALTGAALAGSRKVPLLLGDDIKQQSFVTLREHEPEIHSGYILGGVQAMPVVDPFEVPVATDPMSLKAQDYDSPTGWLCLIDCTANVIGVYTGKQGAWVPYDSWQVTTGKPTNPTIKGVFSIYEKGYSFDGDVYTCYYYSAFSGPYYMHSIIYDKHTFNVRDGQLGTNASMGCVRMPIEKAQWVYENIPINTTVVTY